MKGLHRLVIAAAWSVTLGMPLTALAIDSSDGKSAGAGGPWYVGRVQQATTPADEHTGTGSYLGNNIVLTCAHVLNKLVQPGGGALQMRYQAFQLDAFGPQQYAGLGVMDPAYNVAGIGGTDLGLIITLNMPQSAPVGQNFPVLAGNPIPSVPGATYPLLNPLPNPASPNAANYQTVAVTGYSSNDPNASAERTGAFTINTIPAAGNFGSNLAPPVAVPQAPPIPVSPNAAYTQKGDSGGPWWLPGSVGPQDEIYGVTSYGNQTDTLSIAASVTLDLSFLNGNGAMGTTIRRIDPYVLPPGVAAVAGHAQVVDNFDTGGNFRGGLNSQNALIAQPGFGEIAMLNPLSQYDSDTEVDVTDQTQSLDGLVNNVNLDVSGPGVGLNITYGSANLTGGSGVLNGGIITVDNGASFTSSWKFDNENLGILKVEDNGITMIGYANPNTVGDTVVHNGPGCEIRVDSNAIFKESHRMDNQGGTISVSGASMFCGELLPQTVLYQTDQYFSGGSAPAAVPAQPIVVDNGLNSVASTFTADFGSILVCHNSFSSTVFLNEAMSTFTVSGSQPINVTTATTDSLDNYGETEVSDNATLTNARYTMNEFGGTITVAGGADGPATLISGPLVNDGDFTVSSGGTVTANSTSLAAVPGVTLPTQPFLNGFLGDFTVDTGGKFAVGLISSATNSGTMTFNNSLGYVGLMTNSGNLTVKGSSTLATLNL
jgi:hypothetical protein